MKNNKLDTALRIQFAGIILFVISFVGWFALIIASNCGPEFSLALWNGGLLFLLVFSMIGGSVFSIGYALEQKENSR